MFSVPIYSKDAKGQTREWYTELDGLGAWRTHSGTRGGKKAISGWKVCKTTNPGKANERDPIAQAIFEAAAERRKKLDREYRETVEELEFVPPGPMLAQNFVDHRDKLAFPVYEQPKLDGIRALTFRHGPFSREFQPHNNIEHIVEALRPIFAVHPDVIFDGELYNHALRDDFNTISSVVRTSKNITEEDRAKARDLIQYHVYDLISDNAAPFPERHARLESLVKQIDHPSIVLVPTHYCGSQDALDIRYGMWMEHGYEGQMVRTLKTPYEISKRSKSLLKRKDFETDEFEVVNIEEGVGNWAGYAKRVYFRLRNGDVQGGGMRGNQAFARELLVNKATYIGSPVTIRYFGFTPDGFCRFPVAVDWHPGGRRD